MICYSAGSSDGVDAAVWDIRCSQRTGPAARREYRRKVLAAVLDQPRVKKLLSTDTSGRWDADRSVGFVEEL